MRNSYLEYSKIWRIINHLINGLKVLHHIQIMHRDLKCANIFISKGNYKLGDFNVSKILKKWLAYTQTGTPYYASPEARHDEPYDSKSDIWSLGCAIY
jgi:NIMA (never in mitosis gene a)-related kinase